MEKIKRKIRQWKLGLGGQDTLFEEIWRIYHPKLQVYVQNLYAGEEDIADLVSSILLKSFEDISSYNNKYAFSTWIYTLARNFIVDEMRKKRFSSVRLNEQEHSNIDSPEEIQMRESGKELIRQAVRELESLEKELVFLHFYEGLGYKEISGIIGMPEGTIKYRMSEIRKKLKTLLERRMLA